MKKVLALTNMVTILSMIIINGIAGSKGFFGNTVGGVSDIYNSLFAPAGYAFAIWGIIYLLLTGFAVFQLISAYRKHSDAEFILQIGPWISINSLANIGWIFAWLSENIGISLILMLVILTTHIIMIRRLNMERWKAPFALVAFVWWPIGVYSGWIAVATIANVASYLVSIEWIALFSATSWTVIMIIIAVLLNLLIIHLRNMREFAAVAVWALIAIAVRHWDSIPVIQWTAFTGAVFLLIAIIIHGYINRVGCPFRRNRA